MIKKNWGFFIGVVVEFNSIMTETKYPEKSKIEIDFGIRLKRGNNNCRKRLKENEDARLMK